MVGLPDIVVATPACIGICISTNILQRLSLEESLATLVLDEIFFKSLVHYIPHRCQCILMSATRCRENKKLVLHSPVILTRTEVEYDGVVPNSGQQIIALMKNRQSASILQVAIRKLDICCKFCGESLVIG